MLNQDAEMLKNFNILIFGAGRMGLSHAAMARLICPTAQVEIYDPDFKSRALVRLISGKKIKSISKINDLTRYTHVIIASPPRFHDSNYKKLLNGGYIGKTLVEKPIKLESQNGKAKFQTGYVLRHNKYLKQMISEVKSQTIKTIDISLTTNQDFRSENSNWRMQESFPGQSLLNEFGSHCINIALAFSPILKFENLINESNKFYLQNSNAKNMMVNIQLNAASENVRKSIFDISVKTDKCIYETNLYAFSKRMINNEISNHLTLASEGINSSAYLRGIDFSEQMKAFLFENYQESDTVDGYYTDRIISEIQRNVKNA